MARRCRRGHVLLELFVRPGPDKCRRTMGPLTGLSTCCNFLSKLQQLLHSQESTQSKGEAM